ncbi:MAG: PEP-CTERM sorting domain-containing protein [Burkholderiaceae bacterium]
MFSLSQSGFAKVPEPGSLTLPGLVLAGLAAGVRRRRFR